MRFMSCNIDHYFWIQGDIIIAIYVDNLLVVGKKFDNLNFVKLELSEAFQMTDIGAFIL